MLSLEDVRQKLEKILLRKKAHMLACAVLGDPFGLDLTFKIKPVMKEAVCDINAFDRWQYAWQQEAENREEIGLRLIFESVRWPGAGGSRQVIAAAQFETVDGALKFVGGRKLARLWERSCQRLNQISKEKPQAFVRRLAKETELLESESQTEFFQVLKLENYLSCHRADCYVRELPIEGIDTKFLEKHCGLVCDLLSIEHNRAITKADLYREWHIKKLPDFVRVRHANAFYPGLPPDLVVQLPIEAMRDRPAALVIVENVQTGLAVEGVPDNVPILMGMGFSARLLSALDWIKEVPILYFGDLDMHGLAILAAFRKIAPQVKSVLMNLETLERFRQYAVFDPNRPSEGSPDIALNETEAKLYEKIKAGNLRLEQERIPIDVFENALRKEFS